VPVASPVLIERLGGIPAHSTAIAAWPLLHDEGQVTWRQWFTSVGVTDNDTVSGTNFSDHAMMIAAAAAGHGVALGSLVCAEPYLSSGRLRMLQGPTLPQAPYRIYCDLRTFDDDQVRRLYDWFISEGKS
jgi:LysR family glycine cleavage system transcriptional activator